MILNEKNIRLEPTTLENIEKIIQIEKDNSYFIEQYDYLSHRKVIESEDDIHFSIFEKDKNDLIGHVILSGLRNQNNSIEFRRIVISKKGKGFGKEAIRMLKDYCFRDQGAHRLWLDVFEDNKRAIGLYISQGFKQDGLLRECVKKDTTYRSLLLMSILETEI